MEIRSVEQPRGTFHMMLLDARFTDAPPSAHCVPPSVYLYGVTSEGKTVCCMVNDFLPYFWFPAPTSSDGRNEVEGECLQNLKEYLNQRLRISRKKPANDADSFVAQVTSAYRTPLMYYRPGGTSHFLKIEVWRSKDVVVVARELTMVAERNELDRMGILWKDCTSYEEEIKLGMRFSCDTQIAGGAWVKVKYTSAVSLSHQKTRCAEEFVASWHNIRGLTPDATHHMQFSPMPAAGKSDPQGTSTGIGNETKHGVNMDEKEEQKTDARDSVGADHNRWENSQWLALSPLRVLILNVQCGVGVSLSGPAARSSSSYWTSLDRRKKQKMEKKWNGKKLDRRMQKSGDPSSDHEDIEDVENINRLTVGQSLLPSRDPVLVISSILISEDQLKKIVFCHGAGLSIRNLPGVEVHSFETEHAMLIAWQEFFHSEADPDVVGLYQLKDSIRYLVERFRFLKLGILDISRCKGQATEVKSVVSYGKNWVKQQARMTATSNQEVFRATIEGRVVIDMLRVVLTTYNLSTFTLGECCQVFLEKPKEVLNSTITAELWQGKHGGIYRLITYSLNEVEVTWDLMQRLQTIAEAIEMARVTGLTISEVLYKAQMVRVQSLLLRSAHKEGWLLGGPTINGQLSESPYLIHPKDFKTAGFYKDPVVILDFASLYPSIYMAHNLCYTTLVHPEDVNSLPKDALMRSPTGAHFVLPSVRHGILPRICGALITARKLAKDGMQTQSVTSKERAVLDARQKALKLCSNALYGFTGAGASPQQALPLADSCLSMGAASCKRAVEVVESIFENAKVIYAQTDSVFIKFNGATVEEAFQLGSKAADIASEAFPSPMCLKFEKVLSPFLLLQVNRYAGKHISHDNGNRQGTLFVRGIESERRDVPPFVRTVCKTALQEILINEDVDAALNACKSEIRRLVSGKCSMMELVMTGGLWRVDNNDITRLASSTKSPKKDLGGASTAEEGRGPHVALAVRLKRKDPDRQFHIGERIQYVLVENSSKLQDDMAEDPIDALRGNMQLNFRVYLDNKLRKPLESILEHVIDASHVRDVFTGSHVTASSVTSCNIHNTQASMRRFYKSRSSCLNCRKPLDDDEYSLCEKCQQSGAAQSTAIFLLAEKREIERKVLTGQAECLRCHSGGAFKPILCTNTDCPVFYVCCGSLQSLNQSDSSLNKLAHIC